MGNFATWLMALAWPIVKKVLLALGIGFATYEGLSTMTGTIVQLVKDQWGSMPLAALQMVTLFGFSQALGIILGALTARASMMALGKLAKVV